MAFGAKKLAPMTSLGTLVLAAQFLDILWPNLLLVGVEQVRIVPGLTAVNPLEFVSYPISHSLAMAALWAVLFGLVYGVVRRYRAGAVVAALCVVSHWLLDFIVHVPDLPLVPGGSMKVGLGLWESLPATLAVELAVFAAGIVVYARTTAAADRIGRYGLWGLVLFLAAMYLASVFGPPPPDSSTVAWADQGQWLIVLAAYWIDRHRRPAAAVRLANRAASL